jgi:hypothetical protein
MRATRRASSTPEKVVSTKQKDCDIPQPALVRTKESIGN